MKFLKRGVLAARSQMTVSASSGVGIKKLKKQKTHTFKINHL